MCLGKNNTHSGQEGQHTRAVQETEPTSTRSGFRFGKFCSTKLLCVFFSVVIGLGCSAVALSSYGSAGVSELLDAVSVPDAVAIPVYEVPNMGNQAWLLQDGFRGVPWSYYYDNAGGQLLTALLAAPLYWLFGASYLTLKLVPFLMGLAIMGLIWRFLEGNFNRTAAVIGVLLFALALVAVSARIWLPGDMLAPAPVG